MNNNKTNKYGYAQKLNQTQINDFSNSYPQQNQNNLNPFNTGMISVPQPQPQMQPQQVTSPFSYNLQPSSRQYNTNVIPTQQFTRQIEIPQNHFNPNMVSVNMNNNPIVGGFQTQVIPVQQTTTRTQHLTMPVVVPNVQQPTFAQQPQQPTFAQQPQQPTFVQQQTTEQKFNENKKKKESSSIVNNENKSKIEIKLRKLNKLLELKYITKTDYLKKRKELIDITIEKI